jgi:hypothetical protein
MNFFPTFSTHFLIRFCLQSLCAVLLLSVMISCKKETEVTPDSGRVIFWSSNKAIETVKVDCYVDGTKVGTLSKVTPTAPSCDATGSPVTSVKAGEHKLEFRAANGQNFTETFNVEAGKCVDFELM